MIHFGCIKNGDSGEYVGRACYGYPESPLHNPFRVGGALDPIATFRTYLQARVAARDRGIIQELKRLKALADEGDLTLLCWCRPKHPCHAHVIAEFLEQPMSETPKTLYLIDAFNHIYRAYHANPNLTNGAAFFYTRMIQSVIRVQKPTHVACVFDPPGGSQHRYALHPDYKAGRAKRPEELDHQIPLVRQICEFMGWHPVEVPGAEADDVMATLAFRARRAGFDRIVLVTPDKDLCQLVSEADRISVLHQREGVQHILGPNEVRDRLGVAPAQVVDYLTLLGDSSDNVPGVEGIGDKGAANILGSYGTLDGLVSPTAKLRQAHRDGITQALPGLSRNRELVTVQKDLDFILDLESLRLQEPTAEAQTTFFTEMGFKTLAPGRALADLDDLRPSDQPMTAPEDTFGTLDDLETL